MGGIVRAIGKIVKGAVKAVVGVVKAVVDFVGDVIGFVINPMGAFDTPTAGDPAEQAQGTTLTKQGTNVPIPVIYGFRRVGGINIFTETNGTSNKYLYVVYALSEGPIHGIGRVLVNDIELPLPSGGLYSTGGLHSVSSGRFSGRIKMEFFNGEDTQGQSVLANESATWPKKPRTLPGVAYAVMRFEWKEVKTQEDADNNPFSGGIPNVKFDVFGRKVYDVRNHTASVSQLVGSYSSRQSGAAYSFNPASCLLDYLENPRYGCGLPIGKIHAGSFRIAADKFETVVNYSSTQTGRILTMNAVVNTGSKVLDNLKYLLGGARGTMPYTQGRYKLKVEDGGNATSITSATVSVAYDVTKDNVIGGISMDGERKSTKYNQVIVNFIDPDLDFSNQQAFYTESNDITLDNEEELTGEFTFHTVTNPAIARNLAEMIYKKSRQQRTISFTATQELLDVEVGDIIRVTDTILDLDQQTFRVVGLKLRPDGNIGIEAIEHDATIYPYVTGAQVEVPPALYRPDEFTVIPYVRPLPENPLGTNPPYDPDNPGSPPNLPPSFDEPLTKITTFLDFNKPYIQPYIPGFWTAGYQNKPIYNFYNTTNWHRDPATGQLLNQGASDFTGTFRSDAVLSTEKQVAYFGAFKLPDCGLLYYPPVVTRSVPPRGTVTTIDSSGEGPAGFPYDIVGVKPSTDLEKITQFRSYDYNRIPFEIYGHAQKVSVGYMMYLNMPNDSIINDFSVEYHNLKTGQLEEVMSTPLRDPSVGGKADPILGVKTRTDYSTGLYHPLSFIFFPKSKDHFIRVKWVKRAGFDTMEFADGSRLYEFEQAYPNGYQYNIGAGQVRRETNIEAYFNYLNALWFGTATSQVNVGFSQNLSG